MNTGVQSRKQPCDVYKEGDGSSPSPVIYDRRGDDEPNKERRDNVGADVASSSGTVTHAVGLPRQESSSGDYNSSTEPIHANDVTEIEPPPEFDTWDILPEGWVGVPVQETEYDIPKSATKLKQGSRIGFLVKPFAENFSKSTKFRYTVNGDQKGKGSYGDCFSTQTDPPAQQKVLLKKIANDDFRAKEINAMIACLGHPNIVTLYGVLPFNDHHIILMEHIKGMTLEKRLEENRPNVQQSLQFFLELLEAVFHVHQNGFIHNDIHGDNVMVEHGREQHGREHGTDRIVLIDFGNAEPLDSYGGDYREWIPPARAATVCFRKCLGLKQIPDKPKGEISQEIINILKKGLKDPSPTAAELLEHLKLYMKQAPKTELPPKPVVEKMDSDSST